MNTTRLIAGCMTGTSLDALDVALVEIKGNGLSMGARFIGQIGLPLGPLRDTLAQMVTGQSLPALAYVSAARQLGELHRTAIDELCRQYLPSSRNLDLVVAHGQTICHAPDQSLSWQLMDPWPVVRHLHVPVLYDLRQADLVAGGQGAPITPLADWVMYRDPSELRLVVNLGGICNVTALPASCQPEKITGQDIGPCNLLLDGLVARLFAGKYFDEDGRIARTGEVHRELWDWVMDSSFFGRAVPRSTGREDFDDVWLDSLVTHVANRWPAQDVIASAVDAMARIITDHANGLRGGCHVILAGGGALNPVLVERIRKHLNLDGRLSLSDELGTPATAREAAGFAVLGALSQDDIPITLSAITGGLSPGKAGLWARP